MIIDHKEPIEERTSYNFFFSTADRDGINPVLIDTVKVYIFVEASGDPPVWVNGRDGSANSGLTFTEQADDSWDIALHMLPADNQIMNKTLYAKSGYETHIVRFEVKYNEYIDKYIHEIRVRVRELPAVP